MELKNWYKVRYKLKHIKTISAHSKWEAMDRVYNENLGKLPRMDRKLLTAVLSRY